ACADALVLDAALRQSLVTVRSLGRRGLGVGAADTHPPAPCFASRWCQRGLVSPAEVATEAYRDILEQWLERTGARVLFAANGANIQLPRPHPLTPLARI